MLFLFLLLLSVLPGCRYKDWLDDVFYQGEKVDKHTCTARQYIRSEHVYDQFSPVAHFDALWLSDEVRTAYAYVYACKHCLTQERFNSFLCQQLEENKRFISFYLLAAIPCRNNLLTEKDAEWTICLVIDNHVYHPIEIKLADLSPEYIMFFGKVYTRFKTVYMIRFDAHDAYGNPLISSATKFIQLIFSRPDRKACVTWCLDGNGRVICQKVTHPNVLAYDLQCPCP